MEQHRVAPVTVEFPPGLVGDLELRDGAPIVKFERLLPVKDLES